jgi:WD40 repeat protein
VALQDFATSQVQTLPKVVLWSSTDWSPLWQATGSDLCASLQFSPDEAHLASGIKAGGKNSHVIVSIRNTRNGAYERAISDFYDALDLSYSPDGQTLAVANSYVYLYKLQDIPRYTSESSQVREIEPSQVLKLADPSNFIGASQFLPNRNLLGLATWDGDVLFWKPGDSGPAYQSDPAAGCPPDRRRDLPHLAVSRDGSLLAAALCTNSVAVVEVENPTSTSTIQLPYDPLVIAFHPDLPVFAIAFESGVGLWDLTTKSELCVLDTLDETPSAIGFSEAGKKLLATTQQGSVARWELSACLTRR